MFAPQKDWKKWSCKRSWSKQENQNHKILERIFILINISHRMNRKKSEHLPHVRVGLFNIGRVCKVFSIWTNRLKAWNCSICGILKQRFCVIGIDIQIRCTFTSRIRFRFSDDDDVSITRFFFTFTNEIGFVSHTEIEASFPYRDVQLKKGSISKDIYDISSEELGR